MAVALTIESVSRTLQKGTLRISKRANGSGTARFTVRSLDGSYIPDTDDEVIITDGGSRIFGGLVTRSFLKGPVRGASNAVDTEVICGDFNLYAERRFVNETLASGTLKSMLTLVNAYLDDYGVTLHASQVDGPTLPALIADYVRLDEVLNQMAVLTAEAGDPYLWAIDDTKVLRMYQPSTVAAPFNIADDDPDEVIGDITVEETREQFANRVIVVAVPKQEFGRVESFVGDGVTDTFTLEYTPTKLPGIIHRYVTATGVVSGGETFGVPPDAPLQWEYDATDNTITRTAGATESGFTYKLTFDGVFSGAEIAEDAADILANGVTEKVIRLNTIPSGETLASMAASELAIRLTPTQKVKFQTETAGFAPGESLTITLPTRDLSAVTAVVSEVQTRDAKLGSLRHDITAVIDGAQTNLGRTFVDVLRLWAGDKTGTGGSVTVGDGTIGQSGPAPPLESVQFNDSGRFGGNASYTFDKDTTTVMIGTDHTPGGADNLLVGSGHTVS